jgi:hypothetical protein
MTAQKQPAQMIAPDAYPQMINKADAARAIAVLKSGHAESRAAAAMQAAVPAMRAVILQYVDDIEDCIDDHPRLFDKVHEIRGFAATAGLVTTGRIADVLCHYMDDMQRLGGVIDPHMVLLHVAAILRAARAEDDDVAMGETVARELAALVARKLVDAQAAARS